MSKEARMQTGKLGYRTRHWSGLRFVGDADVQWKPGDRILRGRGSYRFFYGVGRRSNRRAFYPGRYSRW